MTPEEQAAYVDAAAAALALPLADRDAVLLHFALVARMADVVDAVPLGRDDASGESFRPVGPDPA